MFKYPDNIIVNWLRSKMQGKIDSLQSQVDELEKNYFSTDNFIEKSNGVLYNAISTDSFSTDTTGTTSATEHVSFEIIPNAFDYIGKEIFIYTKYDTTDVTFSSFQLGRYNSSGGYVLLNTPSTAKRLNTPYAILCYYKIDANDFTESNNRVGLRFNANQSGHLENQITFSDIQVRII